MAVKFQIRDEVITNDDNYFLGNEEGMITDIRFQDENPIYIVKIGDKQYPFHEEELDFKYSFSKEEVIHTLNEIYNSYGETYEYTILVKMITFPMSALQVKNKFGSVLLDQLLLNRSTEA